MKTIKHLENTYPEFQSTGNAARFFIPFAKEVCKGEGYDIGCNREEWKFPDATPIDLTLGSNALSLPPGRVDYIFSSHCLEHLPNWVTALEHWAEHIKSGGSLALYIPHEDQSYWHPWHNRKHIHSFSSTLMRKYFAENAHLWAKAFVSERDLNHSIAIIAERA